MFEVIWGVASKILSAVALMVFGAMFGGWRARRSFYDRRFFDQLNVSMTYFEDNTLRIRTLYEKPVSEVFLNKAAVNAIVAAAQKTTPEDPLLPLKQDDYWTYLNSVLNNVAGHFSVGQMKKEMGLPVQSERYLLCLTREVAGDIRSHKVRVMVVRKSLLENLPEEAPHLEVEHHSNRWRTLQLMAKRWKSTPHCFLEMEISV
jgi:hypothetical protein